MDHQTRIFRASFSTAAAPARWIEQVAPTTADRDVETGW
jgi:hypothetical protein